MTGDILMSIRPRYAEAILSGQKSHELRRRFSARPAGSKVFVYASSPVCELVGSFSIASVDTMPAWLVARRRRRATTLSSTEILDYLRGQRHGTLIEVADPYRFPAPIDLAQLRAWGLEPPQSYRLLNEASSRLIEDQAAASRRFGRLGESPINRPHALSAQTRLALLSA